MSARTLSLFMGLLSENFKKSDRRKKKPIWFPLSGINSHHSSRDHAAASPPPPLSPLFSLWHGPLSSTPCHVCPPSSSPSCPSCPSPCPFSFPPWGAWRVPWTSLLWRCSTRQLCTEDQSSASFWLRCTENVGQRLGCHEAAGRSPFWSGKSPRKQGLEKPGKNNFLFVFRQKKKFIKKTARRVVL